jgi:hypothetical protein
MKRTLSLFIILFGFSSGISLAGDLMLLARLERPVDFKAMLAGERSNEYVQQGGGNGAESYQPVQREFSGSELGDDVLDSVMGKAMEPTLPTFQAEKSSRIILWDEARIKGVRSMNPGNGRNINVMSR